MGIPAEIAATRSATGLPGIGLSSPHRQGGPRTWLDAPWAFAALLIAWGTLGLFCVHGFPPCVDLPADGAQVESLANLLRHDPAVSAVYALKVPLGYGLVFWLALPLAFLWNGAVAVRAALWATMMLWPLSMDALARSFGRSRWVVLLSLPLWFSMSYWYGYLPMLSAETLMFFALAQANVVLTTGSRRALWALNLLALLTFLSHLVAFALLVFLVGVLALATRPWRTSIPRALTGLVLPVVVSLTKSIAMATRAVKPGPWPATEYGLGSHFNWFFKSYRPEGQLSVVLPLGVTLLLLGFALARKPHAWRALWLFFAAAALYAVTPKTLSGIYLISVRLPVIAAVLSLLVVEVTTLPSLLRGGLALLTVVSLGESAFFHERFRRAVDGLDEAIAAMPPGMVGFYASEGTRILGSKHIYLEHLGQWVTATKGDAGHNFFGDDDHHPVAFKGEALPADLSIATAEQLRPFQHILVFGDGPLPPNFSGFHEGWRNARYRRLDRTAP